MTKEKIEALEFILDRKLLSWEIELLDKWEELSRQPRETYEFHFARGRSHLRTGVLLLANSLYESCKLEKGNKM